MTELAHLLGQYLTDRALPSACPDSSGAFTFAMALR
jgi:hypothetical protein